MKFSLPGMASLLVAIVIGPALAADSQTPPASVTWSAEGLSVDAHGAALQGLMAMVAARSGVTIRGLHHLRGSVSAHFTHQPLPIALKTLLARSSYTLLEAPSRDDPTRKLTVLDIVAGPSAERMAAPLSAATLIGTDDGLSIARQPTGADRAGLRAQAQDQNPLTRHRALLELSTQAPELALELAAGAITSSDAARRIEAVQVLGNLAASRATGLLEQALRDSSSRVRRVALMSLATRPATDNLPYLLAALRDPAVEVSNLARLLLSQKGGSY